MRLGRGGVSKGCPRSGCSMGVGEVGKLETGKKAAAGKPGREVHQHVDLPSFYEDSEHASEGSRVEAMDHRIVDVHGEVRWCGFCWVNNPDKEPPERVCTPSPSEARNRCRSIRTSQA